MNNEHSLLSDCTAYTVLPYYCQYIKIKSYTPYTEKLNPNILPYFKVNGIILYIIQVIKIILCVLKIPKIIFCNLRIIGTLHSILQLISISLNILPLISIILCILPINGTILNSLKFVGIILISLQLIKIILRILQLIGIILVFNMFLYKQLFRTDLNNKKYCFCKLLLVFLVIILHESILFHKLLQTNIQRICFPEKKNH